jgi:hypothetical protein
MYETYQTFFYNVYETGSEDDPGWFPERKKMRGRSILAVAERIAREARNTQTQAHALSYCIWLNDQLVSSGSFGVRRRFRVGDRVEAVTVPSERIGVIAEINPDRARVSWDNGTNEWHSLGELRPYRRA